MLKIIRVVIGAFLAIGLSSVASAQSFDTRNLFFGGGLSQNKIDVSGATSKNGTGYQFFGGYTFGQVAPQMRVDAELGYQDAKVKSPCVNVPVFGCIGGGDRGCAGWRHRDHEAPDPME